VQSLLDEGRITADEADHTPTQRHHERAGRPGHRSGPVDPRDPVGDRYLLCSDRLSGVVSEETIRDAGRRGQHRRPWKLVELALKGGGPDNITAIVADVVEVETAPQPSP
jgi:protein phosphatase